MKRRASIVDLMEIALVLTKDWRFYYDRKRMEELLPANPAKAYISWVFLLKNSGSHPRYSYFALLVL